MSTATRNHQRLITALVCLLAVGVFVLASRAKCSQYEPGSRSTGYFAKATKMSGERCQTTAAVAPRMVPQTGPYDAGVRLAVPAWDPILPKAVSLDSFRYRPPPARVA